MGPLLTVLLLSAAALADEEPRTVGDGTVFMFSPGRAESYGIKSPIDANLTESFSTRHSRMGNSTGIGSSNLQTTSPTSESNASGGDKFSRVHFSTASYGGLNPLSSYTTDISKYGNAINSFDFNNLYRANYLNAVSPSSESMFSGFSPALQNIELPSLNRHHSPKKIPLSEAGEWQLFKY